MKKEERQSITTEEDEAANSAFGDRKFSTAFNHSPLALTITSLVSGRLVEVNRPFEQLSGYSREEAIGRTPEELGLWVQPELRKDRFEQLKAGASVPNIEARFKVKNGEEFIGLIASSFIDLDGHSFVMSSVLDITERKRREMNAELLASISEDLARSSESEEIFRTIGEKIAQHLKASRCVFSEIDGKSEHTTVLSAWHNDDRMRIAGNFRISEFISNEYREMLSAGTILSVNDVGADARTAANLNRFERLGVGSFINVPYLSDGIWKYSLSVHFDRPHIWRPDEIELLTDLSSRVWSRVEKAAVEKNFRLTEEKFRLLTENAKEYAIIFMDTERRITAWNVGAERILGWKEEEIIGKYGDIIFLPEDRATHDPEKESAVAMRQGRTANERWHLRKDGSRFYGSGEMMALYDDAGQLRGFAKLFRDLTKRKEEEKTLRENERQLQQALEAAEQAGRLKDEFLATISHELRTPLNAILGWSHMLHSRAVDPAAIEVAIQSIYTSAKTQAQIIDDLLDVSRIIAGKMQLQPQAIMVSEVLSSALTTMIHAISAKNIRMNVVYTPGTEKITLSADPHRLQQVFWNLISNAVKFTPSNGTIEIRIERTGTELSLMFRDTGVGIPSKFLPLVFERFRQVDSSTTRRFGGLGLGLAITKHLVELHGGTISVESEGEQKGSTFTVRLPLGDSERTIPTLVEQAPESAFYNPKLHGARVLIIDDDDNTLPMIQQLFSYSGAQVKTSTSAGEGLEMLKNWHPDVLISDIAMPHQDGYWLIRQVRSLPDDIRNIPAIALTAYATAADRLKVLAAGFHMFISKPLEPAELLGTVGALLKVESAAPQDQDVFSDSTATKIQIGTKKILLIEDDLLSSEMLRLNFEQHGAEVRAATNASEALRLLQNWRPDLILSDLGLPDEDGCSLMNKIRQIPGMTETNVPAIALTGYGKEEGSKAISAGFQVYQSKPVDVERLLLAISELLRSQKK